MHVTIKRWCQVLQMTHLFYTSQLCILLTQLVAVTPVAFLYKPTLLVVTE